MIRGFEATGDGPVSEVSVDELLRDIFRAMLKVPDHDPMFDSFPLSDLTAPQLGALLKCSLDDSKLVYFLEFDA